MNSLIGLVAVAFLASVFGYRRNWIGVAVINGLPILLQFYLYFLVNHLSANEDTDQSAVGAGMAFVFLLPLVGAIFVATFLGWLAGVGVRTARRASATGDFE